jgi:hypothetical protein
VFSRQRLAQVTDSALKIAHILIRHRGILHFWATQPSPKGVATLVPPLKVEREATYTAEVGGAGPALPGPGQLRCRLPKLRNASPLVRVTSDGDLARDIEIQLLATGDYRVLATGKTNAAGEYAFKAPDAGYHIVATGDKAHVTNMASVDIW